MFGVLVKLRHVGVSCYNVTVCSQHNIPIYLTYPRSRHEVLLGGGGGRIHRHPNLPTPKFSFSLDFGHLIYFENGGKCKILMCQEKRY